MVFSLSFTSVLLCGFGLLFAAAGRLHRVFQLLAQQYLYVIVDLPSSPSLFQSQWTSNLLILLHSCIQTLAMLDFKASRPQLVQGPWLSVGIHRLPIPSFLVQSNSYRLQSLSNKSPVRSSTSLRLVCLLNLSEHLRPSTRFRARLVQPFLPLTTVFSNSVQSSAGSTAPLQRSGIPYIFSAPNSRYPGVRTPCPS